MIKLTYDYQTFCWQRYGGISRYFYELASQISVLPDFDVQILAGAHMNEYLKKCPPGLVKGFAVPRIPKGQKLLGMVNHGLSSGILKYQKPDLLHETFYSPSALAPSTTRVVTTIHDMLPEKFPQYFARYGISEVKRRCVARADHIICVSENTRKDLIELFKVDPAKTSVTYHASSFEQNDCASSLGIKEPFLLYVGGRGGHKNFETLLKVYAVSPKLHTQFKLVCFGGNPLSAKEYQVLSDHGVSASDRLIQLSGDDKLLITLYQKAIAFIYPSLYEGFGIPILEAMSLHCPVVCSETSCFPEVAGDAAEYFDPYDIESLITSIESVVFSTQRQAQLIENGQRRVKEFSWERCAEKTRKIYQSLV